MKAPKNTGSSSTVDKAIIREYQPREKIVGEGDSNHRFYVILKGDVEIFQNNKSIRVLTEGDVFGLENFYLKRPYTTTALALTKARIASYHTDTISEIIHHFPKLIEKILTSIMTQLEQTTQVAEEYIPLEHIFEMNEEVFDNGDIIIKEGTKGNAIYRLKKVEKYLLVTKRGKEIGKISRPGEYFGEMSAILKEKRTATIRSVGQSVVQVFSGKNIEKILETYPSLSKAIIETLAKRLHSANKRIAKISHTYHL